MLQLLMSLGRLILVCTVFRIAAGVIPHRAVITPVNPTPRPQLGMQISSSRLEPHLTPGNWNTMVEFC